MQIFLMGKKQEFPVQSQMQVQLLYGYHSMVIIQESSCAYTHPENIFNMFLSITIIIIYFSAAAALDQFLNNKKVENSKVMSDELV